MKGNIHSIETFGMLDGPGIRVVIFMQGCPLRCTYCHNPDTWQPNIGNQMTKEEILEFILKYKSYFKDTGGVTFSGGEPLLQGEFLAETLKLLKKNDIHTCIDTCGIGTNQEEVLKYTDLVIFDIKDIDQESCKKLVNNDFNKSLEFLKLCQKMNKPLWLRLVIIPGYNDNEEYMDKLAEYVKPIKNVEKIELLPYHSKGKEKYKELNIPYKLDNIEDMDKKRCKDLELYLLELLKNNT